MTSSSVSSCWRLAGMVRIGIKVAPSILQIWYSWGSRTSISRSFCRPSRRCLSSVGVISRSVISYRKFLGVIAARVRCDWGLLVVRCVELGFALFEEGADALATVFRPETLHLLLDFGLEGLLQRVALVAEQDVLDGLN